VNFGKKPVAVLGYIFR